MYGKISLYLTLHKMGFCFRYLPAYEKSDNSLKFELNQIIKNHTEFTYTSSSTDIWNILKRGNWAIASAKDYMYQVCII